MCVHKQSFPSEYWMFLIIDIAPAMNKDDDDGDFHYIIVKNLYSNSNNFLLMISYISDYIHIYWFLVTLRTYLKEEEFSTSKIRETSMKGIE